MKKKLKKLSRKEIDLLKKHFCEMTFSNACDLVYEKQVPNTGIVLIDGELELYRKKKIEERVAPGSLLGVHQMMNNLPVSLGCKVKENSRLIILHKSDLLEVLKDKDSELFPILTTI